MLFKTFNNNSEKQVYCFERRNIPENREKISWNTHLLIRLRRMRAITLNKFQIIIMGNRDSLSSLILSWFRRVEKEKSKQSNKLSRFYYMYTKYVLSPEYKAKLFSDPKIVTLVVG